MTNVVAKSSENARSKFICRNLCLAFSLAFSFLLATNIPAQVSAQIPADTLSPLPDSLPRLCTATKNGRFIHTTEVTFENIVKDKISVIHFCDVGSSIGMANLSALSGIQFSLPTISVVGILTSASSFPENDSLLKPMMNALNIVVPLYFDAPAGLKACNKIVNQPITLIVGPRGEILETLEGSIQKDDVEQRLRNWQKSLANLFSLHGRPFEPIYRKPALQPILGMPIAICADANTYQLFVSDFKNNRILVISTNGDLIDVIGNGNAGFSDGSWTEAEFNGPWGLAWDDVSKTLLVADHFNHVIRKIDVNLKSVETVLGNGKASNVVDVKGVGKNFNLPYPKYLKLKNNKLLISTPGSIWQMDTRTEVAELIYGDGAAASTVNAVPGTSVQEPGGLAFDVSGSIFFAEKQSSAICEIDSEGKVATISGGPVGTYGFSDERKNPQWHGPTGMCIHNDELYIADTYNHAIRKLDPFKNRVTTLAGNGKPGNEYGSDEDASFFLPSDLVIVDETMYICDSGNGLLKKMDLQTRRVAPFPLFNYQSLTANQSTIIDDLHDLDTLFVGNGDNYFTFQFRLIEGFEFDPFGSNTFALSSRHDSLFVMENNMEEGMIRFHYKLEPEASLNDVVIDFNLYLRETGRPEKQYFRGISYILPLKRALQQEPSGIVIVKFDPRARAGMPLAPIDQMYMD